MPSLGRREDSEEGGVRSRPYRLGSGRAGSLNLRVSHIDWVIAVAHRHACASFAQMTASGSASREIEYPAC